MADRSPYDPFVWPGRREHDPAHQRLAALLRFDIQRNLESAEALVNQLNGLVAQGPLATWERVGNAFCLQVAAAEVTLVDTVDVGSPAYTVPLEEVRQAAIAWANHIRASAS